MSTLWKSIDQLIPQEIDAISTTAKVPVGTTVRARDFGSTALGDAEFIYLSGVASTALGDVVTFSTAFATTRGVANGIGPVAVAMGATVAGYYGWYQRKGQALTNVLASFAASKPVFLTATAGSLDDAVVTGDKVNNAVSVTAISSGRAYIWLDHPFVDDATG